MWLSLLASLVWPSSSWAAPEICNGADDDGDGAVDEAPITWFADDDGDGAGDPGVLAFTGDCGVPPGWVSDSSDCDDGLSAIRPGVPETRNGMDDDCDGLIDENQPAPPHSCDWLFYGDSVYLACKQDSAWSTASSRCAASGYHLATINSSGENTYLTDTVYDNNWFTWWIGLWDATQTDTWVWVDGDPSGYRSWNAGEPNNSATEDCVEIRERSPFWNNLTCSTALPFICETECVPRRTYADDDGDGLGDPGDERLECWAPAGRVYNAADCDDGDSAVTLLSWFADLDGDEFGDPATLTVQCDAPIGHVSDATDCDDDDPQRSPLTQWHRDADGDGYGDPEVAGIGCEPLGEVYDDSDCDDENADIHPGAVEVCSGLDEDCDDLVDEEDEDLLGLETYYADEDGDGYGIEPLLQACDPPEDRAEQPGDCDDQDERAYPGAYELCDGVDNNCDGRIDDDVVDRTWYPDEDGDGYGDAESGERLVDCVPPEGSWADTAGDCDDSDPLVHPSAEDAPGDQIDQDCDGQDGAVGSDFVPDPAPRLPATVGCGCGPLGARPDLGLAALALLALAAGRLRQR